MRAYVAVVALVAALGAAVMTSADDHEASCDEVTCGIDSGAGHGPATSGPNLCAIHAHGCSCHLGVGALVAAPLKAVPCQSDRATTRPMSFDDRSADPPTLRPPIG